MRIDFVLVDSKWVCDSNEFIIAADLNELLNNVAEGYSRWVTLELVTEKPEYYKFKFEPSPNKISYKLGKNLIMYISKDENRPENIYITKMSIAHQNYVQ